MRLKISTTLSLCTVSPWAVGDRVAMVMYLSDDLPIRGFIGHLEEGSFLPHNHKTFLWTHLHFSFEYNKDQVRRWGVVHWVQRTTGEFRTR